ncbi:hypothetical protein [Flavimaricola marinus]|uniref:Lipoprotein n=1 Tax=Flavimaricola marinus TaxID=1819565 RepID=A0A238LKL2_9RHOB|nr:hypothetical protein [Flavimaricola marinus]SMY09925.1 hypothetical protein LOM8899_04098 [Flavimaricola marinus]
MRPQIALPLILAACAAAPMTPAEEYAASYVGSYGPTNLCVGQELIVDLWPDRLAIGETACDIASISRAETGISDVGLSVALANCAAEGTAIPNFRVRLLQTQAGLTLASPTDNLILQRCTDL